MDVRTARGMEQIHYTHEVHFDLGGNGYMGAAATGFTGPIMFKSWRVVAFGIWVCGSDSVSGEDPITEFGIVDSDIGPEDGDYWGAITMDTNAGKQFRNGDMFLYDPLKYLKTPLPLENGGEPTVGFSNHFLEWQDKGTVLKAWRRDAHVLGIIPIVCIEVKR